MQNILHTSPSDSEIKPFEMSPLFVATICLYLLSSIIRKHQNVIISRGTSSLDSEYITTQCNSVHRVLVKICLPELQRSSNDQQSCKVNLIHPFIMFDLCIYIFFLIMLCEYNMPCMELNHLLFICLFVRFQHSF